MENVMIAETPFARLVNSHCESTGCTQEELAAKMGLTRPYLSILKKKPPKRTSQEKVLRYAVALQTSTEVVRLALAGEDPFRPQALAGANRHTPDSGNNLSESLIASVVTILSFLAENDPEGFFSVLSHAKNVHKKSLAQQAASAQELPSAGGLPFSAPGWQEDGEASQAGGHGGRVAPGEGVTLPAANPTINRSLFEGQAGVLNALVTLQDEGVHPFTLSLIAARANTTKKGAEKALASLAAKGFITKTPAYNHTGRAKIGLHITIHQEAHVPFILPDTRGETHSIASESNTRS